MAFKDEIHSSEICWLLSLRACSLARVGPLSDTPQTADSYMRMHAKLRVKTTQPLFKLRIVIGSF